MARRKAAKPDPERAADAFRQPLESLPDPLPVPPVRAPFDAAIRPPGSKSITNRLIVLASLCSGESVIRRPLLDAVDVRVMLEAVRRLGAGVRVENEGTPDAMIRVKGVGGRPAGGASLYLENAGTAVRFLTAAAALSTGRVTIDGSERMRRRPIGGLVSSLRSMRTVARFRGEYGFPPVEIEPIGSGGLTGGPVTISTPASSQFISALLLIGPWTRDGVQLRLEGEITSKPYVGMTLALLRAAGARVDASDDMRRIDVLPGDPGAFDLTVEPDASAATYFLAAGALIPGARCAIEGMPPLSAQPDARFAEILAAMHARVDRPDGRLVVEAPEEGDALYGLRFDLSWAPDAAMTLAAVAAFAKGRTVIRGLRTLRDKECDRLAATRDELAKIGVSVEAGEDTLTIEPPARHTETPVVFETYDDHRMAMALALVGLRRPNVAVADPTCVAKTYPAFWADLAGLYDPALSPR